MNLSILVKHIEIALLDVPVLKVHMGEQLVGGVVGARGTFRAFISYLINNLY